MPACVVACSTCRFGPEAREDIEGVTGGKRLIDALSRQIAEDPRFTEVTLETVACLWACGDHCVVQLRSSGRTGYIAGRFTPDEASALAILEYAAAYATSSDGSVPYRSWPEGMKGHFIARIPAAGGAG